MAAQLRLLGLAGRLLAGSCPARLRKEAPPRRSGPGRTAAGHLRIRRPGPEDQADHHRAEALTDLLKAADALDRYRLPKLKWWPSTAHLRVPQIEHLRAVAFDLVVWSEAAHLNDQDSASAVLTALERKELIA
ncbi:hypothetical protein [Streptomyces formicae]|uniref:Uncharacterized protein n=1 Tax=Streptomyces formicae TaxID=1616117 RepID=A0ABY3WRR8_9ACTN|nr:hypothetical protein [Streptomyces formicae]UNM14800.1 hypothetical protein J4032_28015 [Streptomyces formicae]